MLVHLKPCVKHLNFHWILFIFFTLQCSLGKKVLISKATLIESYSSFLLYNVLLERKFLFQKQLEEDWPMDKRETILKYRW